MIDISKIRPGDKVTLAPLLVFRVDTKSGQVAVWDSDDTGAYFNANMIAAHHPAPREIGVGDRVRWSGRAGDWSVEHIAYGQAWISRDDKTSWPNGWLVRLENLTLVEGDQ